MSYSRSRNIHITDSNGVERSFLNLRLACDGMNELINAGSTPDNGSWRYNYVSQNYSFTKYPGGFMYKGCMVQLKKDYNAF